MLLWIFNFLNEAFDSLLIPAFHRPAFTCDTSWISDARTVAVKLNQSGFSEVIQSAVEIEDVRREPDGVLGHFFPISPGSPGAQTLPLSLLAWLPNLRALMVLFSHNWQRTKPK